MRIPMDDCASQFLKKLHKKALCHLSGFKFRLKIDCTTAKLQCENLNSVAGDEVMQNEIVTRHAGLDPHL